MARYTILMTLMGLEIGGAETHVVELSKELKKMGYRIIVASNGGVYEKELEENKVKITQLEEEKTQKLDKKNSLSQNKEKFENELKEKEDELSKLTEKLSTKEIEIENKKQQIEQNVDNRYEKNVQISSLDTNHEAINKQITSTKGEIQLTISELDSTRITKQELSKSFNEIENDRNKILKSLEEANKQKEEAISKIKEFETKINTYAQEERMKTSRLNFLVETEKEKMKSNLLRAVSHDLRTPLTCIVLSATTLLENNLEKQEAPKLLNDIIQDAQWLIHMVENLLIVTRINNEHAIIKKQYEAVVQTEGPCLIIAGAGSGKTKVLTHKIAYLIDEKNIKPWDILAITFTNKAANEMKERVTNLVGEIANDMWIGTFHSICVRILRKFIDRVGFETSFVIFDTSDQKTLMKQILKAQKL